MLPLGDISKVTHQLVVELVSRSQVCLISGLSFSLVKVNEVFQLFEPSCMCNIQGMLAPCNLHILY